MPTPSRRNPPPVAPLSRTMTMAAAARVLGVHRNTVLDRLSRGLIAYEVNDVGHRLPLRASVLRYAAQQQSDLEAAERIPA